MTTPNQTSAPAKPDQPAAKGGDEKNRYRATLNLPQTPFPMKANLVQNEPASIKRWEKLGLYRKVREARKEAPKFAFHDGPPYANGSIHLGHMLNKCLKDFVVRSRSMGSMIGGGSRRWTAPSCPVGTATACPSSTRSCRNWWRAARSPSSTLWRSGRGRPPFGASARSTPRSSTSSTPRSSRGFSPSPTTRTPI